MKRKKNKIEVLIVRSSNFHWKILHVQSELSKLIEQRKITNHQTTEKREIEACNQLQTSLFTTSQLQCIIHIFTNWFIHISSRAPPNKKNSNQNCIHKAMYTSICFTSRTSQTQPLLYQPWPVDHYLQYSPSLHKLHKSKN